MAGNPLIYADLLRQIPPLLVILPDGTAFRQDMKFTALPSCEAELMAALETGAFDMYNVADHVHVVRVNSTFLSWTTVPRLEFNTHWTLRALNGTTQIHMPVFKPTTTMTANGEAVTVPALAETKIWTPPEGVQIIIACWRTSTCHMMLRYKGQMWLPPFPNIDTTTRVCTGPDQNGVREMQKLSIVGQLAATCEFIRRSYWNDHLWTETIAKAMPAVLGYNLDGSQRLTTAEELKPFLVRVADPVVDLLYNSISAGLDSGALTETL